MCKFLMCNTGINCRQESYEWLLLDLLVQSTLVSVRVARFFSQSVFWRVGARDAACWCVLERIGDSAGRSVSARVARFPHSPCSGVSAHVMPRVGAC